MQTLHYIYKKQQLDPELILVLFVFIVMRTLTFVRALGWRLHAERLFPVIPYGRRQLFDSRQEGGYFPNVLFAESLAPGGHAGVAHTSTDCIVNVPLGIIEGTEDELRHRRVKRLGDDARFSIQCAMAESTVHGVHLHAIN